ncbi:hypothetical protein F4678DRAFT_147872 [Xylaria arbuscula]|nr:hypothetical protein F4678DRAFT_147872 [Xylaria arbuscula]
MFLRALRAMKLSSASFLISRAWAVDSDCNQYKHSTIGCIALFTSQFCSYQASPRLLIWELGIGQHLQPTYRRCRAFRTDVMINE